MAPTFGWHHPGPPPTFEGHPALPQPHLEDLPRKLSSGHGGATQVQDEVPGHVGGAGWQDCTSFHGRCPTGSLPDLCFSRDLLQFEKERGKEKPWHFFACNTPESLPRTSQLSSFAFQCPFERLVCYPLCRCGHWGLEETSTCSGPSDMDALWTHSLFFLPPNTFRGSQSLVSSRTIQTAC